MYTLVILTQIHSHVDSGKWSINCCMRVYTFAQVEIIMDTVNTINSYLGILWGRHAVNIRSRVHTFRICLCLFVYMVFGLIYTISADYWYMEWKKKLPKCFHKNNHVNIICMPIGNAFSLSAEMQIFNFCALSCSLVDWQSSNIFMQL